MTQTTAVEITSRIFTENQPVHPDGSEADVKTEKPRRLTKCRGYRRAIGLSVISAIDCACRLARNRCHVPRKLFERIYSAQEWRILGSISNCRSVSPSRNDQEQRCRISIDERTNKKTVESAISVQKRKFDFSIGRLLVPCRIACLGTRVTIRRVTYSN